MPHGEAAGLQPYRGPGPALYVGGIAHLVEHLACTENVAGSNPVTSTTLLADCVPDHQRSPDSLTQAHSS